MSEPTTHEVAVALKMAERLEPTGPGYDNNDDYFRTIHVLAAEVRSLRSQVQAAREAMEMAEFLARGGDKDGVLEVLRAFLSRLSVPAKEPVWIKCPSPDAILVVDSHEEAKRVSGFHEPNCGHPHRVVVRAEWVRPDPVEGLAEKAFTTIIERVNLALDQGRTKRLRSTVLAAELDNIRKWAHRGLQALAAYDSARKG